MSEVATEAPANTNQGDATPSTTTNVEVPQQQQEPVNLLAEPVAESETKTEAQTEEKPQGAPEQYEFKATEGNEFDPEVIQAYSEVAKELGLTQDNAQKVIDKIGPALAQKQARVLANARNEWADESKADKEFGGEKLDENLALANKAMGQFGTPELRSLLNQSGLANHPEILRMLVRTGKAISQDTFVSGSPNPSSTASTADRLYPTSVKKG